MTDNRLSIALAVFPDWSRRTVETYVAAWRLLDLVGEFEKGIRYATRPNGTVNVTRLRRFAEERVAWAIAAGRLTP